MSTDCPCGGTFKRSDIHAFYSEKEGRILYYDTDAVLAHWKCNKCGNTRTQAKRQKFGPVQTIK